MSVEALTVLVGLTLAAVTVALAGRWRQRDITLGLPVPAVAGAQALCGVGIAALGLPAAVSAAAAAAAALGVVTVAADISSQKIAKEPCWVTAAIGISAFLASGGIGTWGWFHLTVATLALIVVPFVAALLTRGGLGFGDLRLLATAAVTLSWWTGAEPLMWGVITACFLQGLARVVSRLRRAPKVPFGPALVAGLGIWSAAALIMA